MLPPENDPFGCGDVHRVETARAAADVSDEKDNEQNDPFHFQVDRSYAGSIAVVRRGDCTFEKKVCEVDVFATRVRTRWRCVVCQGKSHLASLYVVRTRGWAPTLFRATRFLISARRFFGYSSVFMD